MAGRIIATRHTEDLLLGMWVALQALGRVSLRLIWDNESGIGRGKRHADGVGAFTGTLATSVHRLKSCDPESKGVVERRKGFFETSFMPGREFASPADLNAQFDDWLIGANAWIVCTIKVGRSACSTPTGRQMLLLPPVAPAVGWVSRVRMGRDYNVRVDTSG